MNNRKLLKTKIHKKEIHIAFFLTVILLFFVGFTGMTKTPEQNNNYTPSFLPGSGGGSTAPLAKFKKDADVWFKRVGITKKQFISQLPSKAELGVPVYPGAVIVGHQRGFHDGSTIPELILTSSDSVKKIETWYAGKLKNWYHNKAYHAFLPPNKNVDVMSDKYEATPHVEIEPAMSKNQFDSMFLKQPDNTKTGIIIRYK